MIEPESVFSASNFTDPPGALLRVIPDEFTEGDDAFRSGLKRVWNETGPCVGYPKPDGWRIQAHIAIDNVRLFTRNGEECGMLFPAVSKMLQDTINFDTAIFDIELVGYSSDGSHLEANQLTKAANYRCFVLDILEINGKDLTKTSTTERIFRIWSDVLPLIHDCFVCVEYSFISHMEGLINFYRGCAAKRESGYDGAIIKNPFDEYYVKVLKLKSEETIDALVVGIFGSIEEPNYLLLASPFQESWMPIAKVDRYHVKGDVLALLKSKNIDQQPYLFPYLPEIPDTWIRGDTIVEVAIQRKKISSNQVYPIRSDWIKYCSLRADKGPSLATPLEKVLELTGNISWSPGPFQRSLFGGTDY